MHSEEIVSNMILSILKFRPSCFPNIFTKENNSILKFRPLCFPNIFTKKTIFAGLPLSGENIWKMNFFPCQGKVREYCGWPGKFRKDLKVREVREFENKLLWQAVFRKFIYYVQEGKDVL